MISIHEILALKRGELREGALTHPRPGLFQDLEAYMRDALKRAGPVTQWDPDCELLGAVDALDDYFERRRVKIVMLLRDAAPPEREALFPFEQEAFATMKFAHDQMAGVIRGLTSWK